MTPTINLPVSQTSQLEAIGPYKGKLLLAASNELSVIEKSSIRFLKAFSNYCEIHYDQDQRLVCSKTLKSIAARLHNSSFVRVHQSFVINVHYIVKVDPRFSNVTLTDGNSIPVSKANRKLLKQILSRFFD